MQYIASEHEYSKQFSLLHTSYHENKKSTLTFVNEFVKWPRPLKIDWAAENRSSRVAVIQTQGKTTAIETDESLVKTHLF